MAPANAPKDPLPSPQPSPREELPRGVSLTEDAWRRLKRNRVAMTSLWMIVAIGLLAILTPLLPLQPPRTDATDLRFHPPTLEAAPSLYAPRGEEGDRAPEMDPARREARILESGFGELDPISDAMLRVRLAIFGDWSIPSLFGRDALGRDLLSRVCWGARVSLAVGIVATLVSLIIGVSYGAISGFAGGTVDNLMMRLVDVLYSIPFIFVVIFIITILSAEETEARLHQMGIDRIVVFFFVVGAIYWLTMARVVRGQVLSLRNEPFVEAARALGAGAPRIILFHLVPNLMSVVIVYLTLTIPRVMLFEAFLSFLGLGVEPPDVSWGLLANSGLQVITPITNYWWLVVYPGLALGITLSSLNFLGDGLRDALDPRMRNR